MQALFKYRQPLFLSLIYYLLLSDPAYAITKTLPEINTIRANGPLTLILKQRSAQHANLIDYPTNIHIRMRKHILSINPNFPYNFKKKVKVTLRLHQLKRLYVNNDSSVLGKFNSKSLLIYAGTRGYIKLNGIIAVRLIKDAGPGLIHINWIDSNKLDIYATTNSKIKLAGRVNHLTARILGYSKLDAQFLRSQHIMLQTKDNASAKVLPLKSLRAFASGNSNIYYYKRPPNLTEWARQSGNILQIAWRK